MKFLITDLPGSTPIPRDEGSGLLLGEILVYLPNPFFNWEVKPRLDFESAHQACSSTNNEWQMCDHFPHNT